MLGAVDRTWFVTRKNWRGAQHYAPYILQRMLNARLNTRYALALASQHCLRFAANILSAAPFARRVAPLTIG